MDNNNWRPSIPNGEPAMDTGDWKNQLPPDSRQKIVNKIMETLKKHVPFSGPEGINELWRIAARFEDNVFSASVNQTDYLWKISMKLLTMETRSQNATVSSSSIPTTNNATSMDSMPTNQGHLLSGTLPNNQSQAPQPLLSQTMQTHLMDNNNWRLSIPNGEPAMDTGDWRNQLPPGSRQKIVNKIMEELTKHFPFSGPEGINELRRIAARFEDNVFSGAVNQTDYLRQISMNMLTMETRWQNAAGSSSSIPTTNNATSMDSMPTNQGHLLSGTLPNNQSQASQPLLSQTMQSNTASGMSGSTPLPSSMPPVSSITNNNVPGVVNQNSSMQNVSGMLQDSSGQHGLSSNMFSGSQRQMLGRPRTMSSQQQQQQLPQSAQYLYQQQLQQQLLRQNFQSGNVPNPNSLLPQHIQQQQQNVLQPNQMHSSQQPGIPTSARQPSDVSSAPLQGLHTNQQSSPQLTIEIKAQNAACSSSPLPIPDANNNLAIVLGDWRTQQPPDSRQKNVNNLMETLKKHVPYSGQDGIEELRRIAISFEELIFNTAINQMDYFRKISLKMRIMEEGD